MFTREKIPFVLAGLLGFLTWTLTRAVDRVVETPIVRYSVAEKMVNGVRVVSFDLKNISTAELKNVRLVVLLEGSAGKFEDGSPPVLEAELPMIVNRKAPPEVSGDSATFTFPELQPGARFRLTTRVSADAVPALALQSPDAAVRLLQPSLQTFLVEKELALLMTFSVATTILVIFYSYLLWKRGG